MAAATGRHSRYPYRRTLRQTQTPTGDSNSCALVNADPKTSRVVYRSDGGGIGGIDLEDLYSRPKRRRSQRLNSLPVGKTRKHAGSSPARIFQSCLLFRKVQAFDDQGLARANRNGHHLFHGIAHHGLGLRSPLAVSNRGNVFAALEIAATVEFG